MKCPVCFPDGNILPVGTSYGCLTIIDGFDAYQKEVASKEIARFQKEKEDFLNSVRHEFSNVDSADFYDYWINDYKNRKLLNIMDWVRNSRRGCWRILRR